MCLVFFLQVFKVILHLFIVHLFTHQLQWKVLSLEFLRRETVENKPVVEICCSILLSSKSVNVLMPKVHIRHRCMFNKVLTTNAQNISCCSEV